MIPSYKILFQGIASGVFSIVATIEAGRGEVTGMIVCALLAVMFFFFGASNADKLHWRPSNAKTDRGVG